MTESTADVRHEMDVTRARMSLAVDELEARLSESADAVKEKLDVMRLVREHPWIALGVAVGAGALLGGTGADRAAAEKGADAARRGARATADATKRGAQAAVAAVRSRFGGADEAQSGADAAASGGGERGGLGGVVDRAAAALGSTLGFDHLLDEMRRAAGELGRAMPNGPTAPHTSITPVMADAAVPTMPDELRR